MWTRQQFYFQRVFTPDAIGFRFRYSFICQDTSTIGDSEVTFSVFESSCYLLLSV